MKNKIRIVSVILLTSLYGFAISLVTQSFSYADFHTSPNSSSKKVLSDFSAKLFCHTPQSEISVTHHTSLPVPTFKNSLAGYWVLAKITERLIGTAFSQYTSVVSNILIKYRKSDIIFPFHYFW